MGLTNEALANSLKALKHLQESGRKIIRSGELPPESRKRLLDAGYLIPVSKGWYASARPSDRAGDSTAWLAAWRDFVSRYATSRFREDWHLTPELSLMEHVAMPPPTRQIIVSAPKATNNALPLPFGWSLLELKAPSKTLRENVTVVNGLRVLTLPYALTKVSEAFFTSQKTAAELAIGLVRDPGDLATALLTDNQPVVAGRLIAALAAAGREADAATLRETLRVGGYDRLVERNPFETPPVHVALRHRRSPYVARIHAMWASMRDKVIEHVPAPPGLPTSIDAYLADVDDRYASDAYHSLSIEGYTVTNELIELVRSGAWNVDDPAQKQTRDAMAAKGYYEAHLAVRSSIQRVLGGANPGEVAAEDHRKWNLALWTPAVQAGIVSTENLGGYRNMPVLIRDARHAPPPHDAVRDLMPELFELLTAEEQPAVRAVMGHFVFVFIHPYIDGNGRLGRFLMNAMLASGGYPWTIIKVEDRDRYFAALESASSDSDIEPFATFIGEQVAAQIAEKPAHPRRKARP